MYENENYKCISGKGLGLKKRQAKLTSAQIRRRCHNNVNENMWGASPPTPPK